MLRQAVELQREGRLAEAAEAYESALKAGDRRSALVLATLGSLYLRLERPARAVELLSEAMQIEPGLTGARMPLAVAYLQSGKFAGCVEEAEKIVEGDKTDAKASHLLGLCRLKMGALEEGAADLERALATSSDQPNAAYTLVTTYATLGLLGDAERVRRLYLADVDTPEALLVDGAIHKARGEHQLAIETIQSALERTPDLPTANELLGRSLVAAGRLPEAEDAYARELAIDPTNFNANAVLSWIRLRDKRYDEAVPLIEEALRQRPSDTGLLFLQAQIDDAKSRYEEAAAKLEAVVEAQPENRAAHVLLARAYAKLKKREEFRREKDIIQRLTEQEQERNVLREKGYRGPALAPPGEP